MTEQYQSYPCDLCGADDPEEITVARRYTDDNPLHVCRNCGFVYIRERRSSERVADVWTDDIYQKNYTARIPYVVARQSYVADFIDTSIGLKGKSLADVGAGEGQFLSLVEKLGYGANCFGIEPSPENTKMIEDAGFGAFTGTAEQYGEYAVSTDQKFDVATVMWTVENSADCRALVDSVYGILKPGGHIVVATGSRILVPFKKPLHYYLAPIPPDTHCFRFSANTLQGLLAVSGFETTHVNRYIDGDFLVVIAKKTDKSSPIPWEGDDYKEVVGFFDRWDKETQGFYADT